MGYMTFFTGNFKLDKPFTVEQAKILNDFSEVRHEGGKNGYNGFPFYYCNWVPTKNRKAIFCIDGDHFYHYISWLRCLIKKFLKPWDLKLNGKVKWVGWDDDHGIIIIKDNIVTTEGTKPKYGMSDPCS